MKITWDPDNRPYSGGVSQGVLYPGSDPGVPWNGLISVKENAGNNPEATYFDGRRISSRVLPVVFSGTISAFTFPDEFGPYIGYSGTLTAQVLQPFGFSFRTNNEIHLVYNALIAPSAPVYSTEGTETKLAEFEWDFITGPVKIPGGKPSSHLVIMTDDSDPAAISELEDLIYGNDTGDPVLPLPEDIIAIFESHTILRITDNGDGTWTADGPDTAITILDADTFQISGASVIIINNDTYRISSL